jgi:hypothetical protein
VAPRKKNKTKNRNLAILLFKQENTVIECFLLFLLFENLAKFCKTTKKEKKLPYHQTLV